MWADTAGVLDELKFQHLLKDLTVQVSSLTDQHNYIRIF
jgi:hypothetical protein